MRGEWIEVSSEYESGILFTLITVEKNSFENGGMTVKSGDEKNKVEGWRSTTDKWGNGNAAFINRIRMRHITCAATFHYSKIIREKYRRKRFFYLAAAVIFIFHRGAGFFILKPHS